MAEGFELYFQRGKNCSILIWLTYSTRNPRVDHFWSTLDKLRFQGGQDLVHPGPLLVQPEMTFFTKSLKINEKINFLKFFFPGSSLVY